MDQIFTALLQWTAGVSGGLLIYCGVFLYENEDGHIQNTIENWWLRLEDQRQKAISRHTAVLENTAILISRSIDKLCGRNYLSLRLVVVSTSFSLSSLYLFDLIGVFSVSAPLFDSTFDLVPPIEASFGPLRSISERVTSAFLAVTFLGCAFLSARVGVTIWLPTYVACLAAFVFFLPHFLQTESPTIFVYAAYTLGVLVGLTSDLIFLTGTRILFRYISNTQSASRSLRAVALTLPILAASFLGIGAVSVAGAFGWISDDDVGLFLALSTILASMGNFPAILASSSILLISVGLILHKLIWPVIQRPIYAIARFGVIRQKKTLMSLGVALVAIGVPPIGGYLSDTLQTLRLL